MNYTSFDLNKILPVVVLYNPTNNEINRVIKYSRIFSTILVLDNSMVNIGNWFSTSASIKYVHNNGQNLGLSKAYNISIDYCIQNNFAFMFVMDQDSDFPICLLDKMKEIIERKNLNLSKCAILALNPQLESDNKLEPVTELTIDEVPISSGSIININIAKHLGGFDERFFIDSVDIEYALKVLENKYQIVKFNNLSFGHEVGHPRICKHMGEHITSSNHNHLRYYYLIRNNLLLDSLYNNKDINNRLVRHIAEVSKINTFKKLTFVRYEENRLLKYYYSILGMYHFSIGKFGKIPDENILQTEQSVIQFLLSQQSLVEYFIKNLSLIESAVNKSFLEYNNEIIKLKSSKSFIIKRMVRELSNSMGRLVRRTAKYLIKIVLHKKTSIHY